MRESIPTLIRQMNIGGKMEAKIENSQKRKKSSSFQKFKQYLNSTRAENLILWIYTAFSFFLVLIHEPWRDEAQFWLLARDASIPEILSNISKEGIPPLWQLMLKPFVMLGLPYYPTMNIISFILVAAAAWIFVKKAPFQRCVKYILLFSPVFIYCYATISRTYSMMPLIVVLLAVLYPKRLQRPIIYGILIALLFEIHVILWGMVAALSVEFLISTIRAYKKGKSVKQTARSLTAVIPMLIVGLQYLLFFYPAARTSYALGNFALKTNPLNIIYHLYLGIGTVFGNTLSAYENVGWYVALIFLAISLISIFRDKRWIKYVLIAGGSILFEGIVSGFIYIDGNFRSISVFLILMFAIWLAKNDGLSLEIVFFNTRTTWVAAVCLYTILGMLAIAPNLLNDIRYPYSYSKYAASYIEQNIPSNSLILTSSSAEISAIAVYLEDYTFYDTEKEKPFSYFVWNKNPSWLNLYGVTIDGVKQLPLRNRLYLVAQEAIKQSNGTEDGFYYITIPEYSTKDSDAIYREHMIYETPEERESKENYQILYISFEDARQLIESDSNPE